MHNLPREVLQRLIETYGPQLADDPPRCRNLLRDMCGQYQIEINVLQAAQEERVPTEIRSWEPSTAPATAARQIELTRLVTRLVNRRGLNTDAAQWAVESWAFALGVIDTEIVTTDPWNFSRSRVSTPDEAQEIIYQLMTPRLHDKPLKLRLKQELQKHPPSPLWYEDIVNRLSEYIQGATGKPIILTGYGSFGGSCLIHWAINNARMAMATGSNRNEAEVVLAVDVNLVGRGYDDFWMVVRDWFDDIQLSDSHTKLKKRLGKYFDELKEDLYLRVTERTKKKVRTGVEQEVKFEAPSVGAKLAGGRSEEVLEERWVPRDEKTPPEFQRLRALMHMLPNLEKELQSWWRTTLGKLRRDGRPYRIVFVLDKIDDLRLLKEIDLLLTIRGGFRIVVILDRHYYDLWAGSDQKTHSISNLLTQRFEVLKCRPVWDDNIARSLCEQYFILNGDSSNEQIFIDGLNFACGGSPGIFMQLIQKYSKISNGYLVLNPDILPSLQVWAKIGRILREKKNQIYLLQPLPKITTPHNTDDDPISRGHLFLNLIAKRAIDMSARGLTKQSLATAGQEEADKTKLLPEVAREICNRLVDLLYEKRILTISNGKTRAARPSPKLPQRELHFIWICDVSESMLEDGKIQAFNNAVKESIPHLQTVAHENPSARVSIRAIKFSTDASWHVEKPIAVERFKWPDLSANGVRNTGRALRLLAHALQSSMPKRGLPPVLVLCTDGNPTDDFDDALRHLDSVPWWKKSVRIAIALGDGVDHSILSRFSGDGTILKANNPEALVRHIRWVSTTASIPSQQVW